MLKWQIVVTRDFRIELMKMLTKTAMLVENFLKTDLDKER